MEPLLATARSGLPSPLKSPTATDLGLVPAPTVELWASGKSPAPSPSRIVTFLERWLATARSGLPSRLKSATVTELGFWPAPTVELLASGKSPVPSPKRIVTLWERELATAR